MTRRDVNDRNRANAAKSTGPKTSRGKAVSAQNARRHGATSAPDPSNVSAWLSVILERPHILPSDLMPMDEVGRTALNLAQAEARLAAAEQALAEFEAGEESDGDDLDSIAEHIRDALSEPWTTPRERKSGIAILARIAKTRLRDAAGQARRHRLLARYAREARSARSRAISAWAAAAASRHHQHQCEVA